jgi:DNA-binding helix-hairpin-helix protein with protein kinase domain
MTSNTVLKPKEKLQTESGMSCEVGDWLGGGGQGEVYRVNLAGKTLALKWYYPEFAKPWQREALSALVKRGAPNDKFLWPLELVVAPGRPDFGYIMPLRESRYHGIMDLMMRRVTTTFRQLATAGFYLADSYFQLHTAGLCYRDISFGNAFFDPKTGDVLICDNDNVTVDGSTIGGVFGTSRFMAPEIVRGQALPSTTTDLFSLSVLLFYLFMIHHPLEGKKEYDIPVLDMEAMTRLYGLEPVFIFDPNDESNRPVPGYQDNALIFWPIYPQFLRDLFTRAFTDGLKDPENGRVRENEWRSAMIRLRDSIFYCPDPQCNAQNFYDVEQLKKTGSTPAPCWKCKKEVKLPFRIRIGDTIIMLNRDTQLYPHHINRQRKWDFSHPVAEVSRHPTDPTLWGLKNLTNDKWVLVKPDSTTQDVEPGRSASLAVGNKILFGTAEGEIRY